MPDATPGSAGADPDDQAMQAVLRLANALLGTLRMAGALIGTERRVDLAGIDRDIGLLCAKSLDLPLTHGRLLRPMLFRLLAETDALIARLDPGS